jgi:hypothetical protein
VLLSAQHQNGRPPPEIARGLFSQIKQPRREVHDCDICILVCFDLRSATAKKNFKYPLYKRKGRSYLRLCHYLNLRTEVPLPRSESYSLVADAICTSARSNKHLKEFRAHLVTNLLSSERLVFSDSQYITSPNLRRLLQTDDTLRGLVKDKLFCLAGRKTNGEENDLVATKENHRDKVHHVPQGVFESNIDLELVREHAPRRNWDFSEVSKKFTELTQKIIDSPDIFHGLPPEHYKVLRELVAEYRENNSGILYRTYFHGQLLGDLVARVGPIKRGLKGTIKQCSDGPYFATIPSLLGAVPVHASEHENALKMLKGIRYRNVDDGKPKSIKRKLDHEYFIHGINLLGIDDIQSIRADSSTKKILEYKNKEGYSDSDLDEMALALEEHYYTVQNRIISKFPELKRRSKAEESAVIRRQRTVAEFSIGSFLEASLDVANIVFELPVPLGSGFLLTKVLSYTLDMVTKKKHPKHSFSESGIERLRHAETSAHWQEVRRTAPEDQRKSLIETTTYYTDSFQVQVSVK